MKIIVIILITSPKMNFWCENVFFFFVSALAQRWLDSLENWRYRRYLFFFFAEWNWKETRITRIKSTCCIRSLTYKSRHKSYSLKDKQKPVLLTRHKYLAIVRNELLKWLTENEKQSQLPSPKRCSWLILYYSVSSGFCYLHQSHLEHFYLPVSLIIVRSHGRNA